MFNDPQITLNKNIKSITIIFCIYVACYGGPIYKSPYWTRSFFSVLTSLVCFWNVKPLKTYPFLSHSGFLHLAIIKSHSSYSCLIFLSNSFFLTFSLFLIGESSKLESSIFIIFDPSLIGLFPLASLL